MGKIKDWRSLIQNQGKMKLRIFEVKLGQNQGKMILGIFKAKLWVKLGIEYS